MIPYGRQAIDESDIDAVVDVLRGDWLTQGPAVAEFEAALAERCGAPYAVAFSSGTAALHGAAFAAGVSEGDELVTSALTFAASANCAAYLGATPRFADIQRATWNVDPDLLLSLVGPRTRAVVPVDFAGLPAAVDQIRAGLPEQVVVIEDAAHALGAEAAGEPVGSCRYADMTVFSFHPVKAIASGEGGMVTTRDERLRDRLRVFRTHGITKDANLLSHVDGGWYQEQVELGFNYRLSDIHSALGRSQLRRLDEFIDRRNAVAARYRDALGDVDRLELCPPAPAGSRHAYHLFVIRHRDGAQARRRLYDELRTRGILTQVHYLPVYLNPWYQARFGYGPGLCPEAERYYEGCLSIPCYATLSEEDQDRVIDALRTLA
jgi:UDP-4-amino-4,6-dideoxy-N-acetyl-beta-L-altrosamine transaminase